MKVVADEPPAVTPCVALICGTDQMAGCAEQLAKHLLVRCVGKPIKDVAGFGELLAGALDIITSKVVKEYGAWFELADWRAIPEEYQCEYVDPWLVTAQTVMQKLAEEPVVDDGQ